MRLAAILVALALLLAAGRDASAQETATDVNIVTGLDVSGSIESVETRIQVEGMVTALRSPRVVAAIESGRRGQIGFAVFIWANGARPVFSGWKLIATPEDAFATSRDLAAELDALLGSYAAHKLGELTDLSGAIDFGGAMLAAAPFATDRSVLNILGNGIDNVGGGPRLSRDLLVAQGMTVNGVVIGHDRGVFRYFRDEVIGGPGAFVLAARDAEMLVDVMERKFVTEIAFNPGAASQAPR